MPNGFGGQGVVKRVTKSDRAVRLRTNPPRPIFATAIILAIIYGSLYPFHFEVAKSLAQDVLHLAATWRQPPQGRGDFLANLLLYAPFGLTVCLALGERRSRLTASILTLIAGAVLSVAIELAQFYDRGRVSVLSDVYLNAVGTLIGVMLAWAAGFGPARKLLPSGSAPAFARLLLLAWLGWRLYPYAPTIDLHKYWYSIRPLFLAPEQSWLDIVRYTALWLSVFFLLHTGFQPRKTVWLFLPAMLCYFMAKILIVGQNLSRAELGSASLAFALSFLILPRYRRIGIPLLAGLLMAIIIMGRLLPWELAAQIKEFHWIPFFGFLHGSMQVDIIAFSEKFYLYGAMLLLLVAAGLRLINAAALLSLVLLATSVAQMFLVGRSAEITDALLALALGLIYALLRWQYREGPG